MHRTNIELETNYKYSKYITSVCGIGKLITLDSDTLDNTLLVKKCKIDSL